MDNCEHQKDCICAWCEVERQNVEIRRDRDASARRSEAACSPVGVEARVSADIAARQRVGILKYGTTVADNPLPLREWLEHAYQESLDLPIYLKRAIEEIDRENAQAMASADEKTTPKESTL